ncbi:MAG: TVP38/TMEM64 family protein [Anaerovoracaceae bacterium]|jgi:uncharacterized membrane protein YdjX (TVP38/TMEM64 family)
MVEKSSNKGMILVSAAGLACCAAICIWSWHAGLLSSQEKLNAFVSGLGYGGIIFFIILQAVQVVFPIMPGGISCLAGVVMFGALNGFLYNYIGICAGSVAAFLISKKFGKPVLNRLFSRKTIDKYESWTSENNRFEKLFAIGIFLPVAPDDFLCYLAGTTNMSLKKFIIIILLGKPAAIALYSAGLKIAAAGFATLIGA